MGRSAVTMFRVIAFAALLSVRAGAQSPPTPEGVNRPQSARRVVSAFDFEEREFTLTPVPPHWVRYIDLPPKLSRPGYPRWNASGYDDAIFSGGKHSVRIPTEGGSAALQLASGAIPTLPGADYSISARARTQGLTHAVGRLTARFLDEKEQLIPGSETHSETFRTQGRWIDITTELTGRFERAAWIQIDLELLQPAQQEAAPATSVDEIKLEDISGAVWFDDVVVKQLPKIELKLNSGDGFITSPSAPTLTVVVRDMTGEPLRGRLTVSDLDGRVVDSLDFKIQASGRPTSWSPALKRFGWLRVDLDILNEQGVVGRRRVDFIWTPRHERPLATDTRRFGLIAEDLDPSNSDELPMFAQSLGVGAVQLSIWSNSTSLKELPTFLDGVARTLERLLRRGQEVTLTLAQIPAELARAARIEGDDPFVLLERDANVWTPYINDAVSRFGQRIHRWQFGATSEAVRLRPRNLASDVKQVESILSRLAPAPVIVAPRSAVQMIDAGSSPGGAYTISIPASFDAASIEALAKVWPQDVSMNMVIELPPPSMFSRRASVIELFRRLVYAWKANPDRVSIRSPWRQPLAPSGALSPTPEAAVYRTLIERLSNRRVVGAFPTAQGATALIIEGRNESAIIAWNKHAAPEDAVINAYLADGPVRLIDPFDNETLVEATKGLHHIRLRQTPVIIEGVDVNLAKFRAAFRIEPAFLESAAARHTLYIIMENPWPNAISGKIRIAQPQRWRITPRVQSFSLGAGQKLRLPVEASFGVSEEAGSTDVEAEIELVAAERYPLIRVHGAVKIGLPDVQLTPAYQFQRRDADEPSDLIVTLLVTNVGRSPLTMLAYAQAPGFSRRQAPVSSLAPGESTIKRFVLRRGGEALRGRSIRVGLIDPNGPGRLNKSLIIE